MYWHVDLDSVTDVDTINELLLNVYLEILFVSQDEKQLL